MPKTDKDIDDENRQRIEKGELPSLNRSTFERYRQLLQDCGLWFPYLAAMEANDKPAQLRFFAKILGAKLPGDEDEEQEDTEEYMETRDTEDLYGLIYKNMLKEAGVPEELAGAVAGSTDFSKMAEETDKFHDTARRRRLEPPKDEKVFVCIYNPSMVGYPDHRGIYYAGPQSSQGLVLIEKNDSLELRLLQFFQEARPQSISRKAFAVPNACGISNATIFLKEGKAIVGHRLIEGTIIKNGIHVPYNSDMYADSSYNTIDHHFLKMPGWKDDSDIKKYHENLRTDGLYFTEVYLFSAGGYTPSQYLPWNFPEPPPKFERGFGRQFMRFTVSPQELKASAWFASVGHEACQFSPLFDDFRAFQIGDPAKRKWITPLETLEETIKRLFEGGEEKTRKRQGYAEIDGDSIAVKEVLYEAEFKEGSIYCPSDSYLWGGNIFKHDFTFVFYPNLCQKFTKLVFTNRIKETTQWIILRGFIADIAEKYKEGILVAVHGARGFEQILIGHDVLDMLVNLEHEINEGKLSPNTMFWIVDLTRHEDVDLSLLDENRDFIPKSPLSRRYQGILGNFAHCITPGTWRLPNFYDV